MTNWYTFQSAYDMYWIISEKLYNKLLWYKNVKLGRCQGEVCLEKESWINLLSFLFSLSSSQVWYEVSVEGEGGGAVRKYFLVILIGSSHFTHTHTHTHTPLHRVPAKDLWTGGKITALGENSALLLTRSTMACSNYLTLSLSVLIWYIIYLLVLFWTWNKIIIIKSLNIVYTHKLVWNIILKSV